MEPVKISVCVPTYNMGALIGTTLKDILAQSFRDFEVIVSDNASTDNTEAAVRRFDDRRVKYFKNAANVGYAENLNLCAQRSAGDILFLMSAKSRLSEHALRETYMAFFIEDDIGAVTRPYFWFGDDIHQPVRAKSKYAKKNDLVVSIHDEPQKVIEVFKTLDNPAGLAFRKKNLDVPFHKDAFVEFIYPFASIFKKHKVVLLKNYTMACPAWTYSGSQNPHVYKKSPLQCWIDLFEDVFPEPEFSELRRRCIKDFVAVNYVGLAQVRNYGGIRRLLREIVLLVKFRPLNLCGLRFWIFSLGSLMTPAFLLKRLASVFKRRINSKLVSGIRLGA